MYPITHCFARIEGNKVDIDTKEATETDETEATVQPQEREATVQPQKREATVPPQEREAFVQPQEREAAVQPQEREAFVPPQEREAFVPPQKKPRHERCHEDVCPVPHPELFQKRLRACGLNVNLVAHLRRGAGTKAKSLTDRVRKYYNEREPELIAYLFGSNNWHIDHIIPRALAGFAGDTVENLTLMEDVANVAKVKEKKLSKCNLSRTST